MVKSEVFMDIKILSIAFGCTLAFAGVASAATQAIFYVAPGGSDSNKGTKDAPFKTITQAQKAVRAINGTMTGDIEVILREGTYVLPSTIGFDNRDGGQNGHYVRYKAFDGEHPLISGGMGITGWTIHDEKNNIWKVEGVDARFRQMYVNNKKAVRARMPNLANGDHNFFRLNKVDSAGSAFLLNNSDIGDPSWKNLDKVEIHLMIAWSENILRASKITKQGNVSKFEPQDPERTKLFRRKYPMLGTAFSSNPPKQQVYYLENAYEFIDDPGEWFLDESTNTLYYKAREGENMQMAHVAVPRINTLISILGKDTKNKVGYLSFEGLTFAHTNYLRPSEEGFLDLQGGMFNVDVTNRGLLESNEFFLWRPDAGFRAENAHHINVSNCVFTQMAATGLDFVSGTNDDMIQGNVFYEIGASGIMLGKYSQDSTTEVHIPYNPTDKDEICTRDTIQYNLITHVTNEHQGATGIGAGYPRDAVIEHNEVSYTNYIGISVGYGWTTKETAMNNNHINWNNIHHVARLLCDSGPIYTLSNQGKGGEIKNNYLHDISQSKWSDYWILPIYLDEGSSGFEVAYNVFENAPSGAVEHMASGNYLHDNNGHDQGTISKAGLQGEYKGLADRINSIPLADFSNTVAQVPYKVLFGIPGAIQAEDYDEGGQSVSFSDKDFVNEGNVYREDGVDIVGFGCSDTLNTQDCEGYAIGYTQAGEWVEYSVNVTKTAKYVFRANVASGLDVGSFRLFLDGKAITDTVAVPQGDDWVTYGFVEGETAELEAGEHVLRVQFTGTYVNLDWIQFALTKAELSTVGIRDVAYNVNFLPERQGALKIYNANGRFLGRVDNRAGLSLAETLKQAGFAKGIYIVRGTSLAKSVRVRVK